ncbi:MAG: hypothetical protein J7J98_01020 [candidate division Zixibacteria bacterium]|nr:hypothetical protein [candidate division Zixibacteria bacterium]
MLKFKLLFVVIATMILGVVMFVGCDSDKGVYSSGESVSAVEANNTNQPESTYEDADNMYTWDDAYGQEIMDKAATRYTVKSYLDNYESQGYAFAPEHSFVVEGYGIPDGGTDSMLVQFVTLAMTYTPDPTRQAMYVTFTESELGFIIAPYMLSFVEPDPDAGFTVETDGVWQLNFPAEVGHYRGRSTDGPAALTLLDDYLDCLAEGTAAGCATTLLLCAPSGLAYPECVAAGCTIALIGSVIGCVFVVWG